MTDVRSVNVAAMPAPELRVPEMDQRVQETPAAPPEEVAQPQTDLPQPRVAGDPLNKSVALLNLRGDQPASGATASTAFSAPASKTASLQQKMDAYYDRSNSEYTLPDGSKVRTRSQFEMNFKTREGGDFSAKAEEKMNQVLQPKDKSLRNDIHSVAWGRATPEQIQRVTQALIDKGALTELKQRWEQQGEQAFKAKYPNTPYPPSDADAVKLLQWSMGAGVDCAGYAQQEFLAVHGGTHADYGLQDLGNENLQDLKSNPHFQQVGPTAAQPGDLLIMRAPEGGLNIGHDVMVQDRHELTDAERANYPGIDKFAKPGDKVHVITVEGSFGPGGRGEPGMGGVQRRTFFYNETTKQWADMRPDRNGTTSYSVHVSSTTGAYNHPLDGIYRPKQP